MKAHALSTCKLGVTGFCWGGGTTNFLAATLGADMHAGVPFYGAAAETARVPDIKAPLMIQYAETDERINAMWPAFEAAMTTSPRPGWPGSARSPSSRSTWPDERAGPLHGIPFMSTGA